MDIADLTAHYAGLSATGAGALVAAWFTWRMWRRVMRTLITCVVVGLVVYTAFPDVVQRLVDDKPSPVTSDIDVR